jgi:DNA-binding response OmpR family regulator
MPELLIIDDEEALRGWVERVMRDNGYSCDGVGDAASAREHLNDRQHCYRLALLDLNSRENPGSSC